MKYINADSLKAEIERLRLPNRYIDTEGYESELLDIITSLQQEQPQVADASKMEQEVDELDNDKIIDYAHSKFYYDKDFDGYGHSKFRPVLTREDLISFARHFAEWGAAHSGAV